jgi:hypothetical protein
VVVWAFAQAQASNAALDRLLSWTRPIKPHCMPAVLLWLLLLLRYYRTLEVFPSPPFRTCRSSCTKSCRSLSSDSAVGAAQALSDILHQLQLQELPC